MSAPVEFYHPRPEMTGTFVSPLAYVAPWVRLSAGVVVHPFAVVGREPDQSKALARKPQSGPLTLIGDNTVIGPGAIIYSGVEIGADCLVGDHASIRENTKIGDRCVIGRLVTINYDCEIGNEVRLQDTTHITGGCKVGDGCFFGVGIITSNDRNVDLVDYHFPGAQAPNFGRRVMVGSGANILAGVNVGDDALIGAGALVVTDVPANGRMLGPKASLR